MARPEDPVLCPACGARNKARWEFCARCGESLQGAEPAAAPAKAAPRAPAPGADAKAASKRSVVVIHPRDEEASAVNAFFAGASFLAMVATIVAATTYACRSEPPPPPAPAGLTIPTVPPKPVAASADTSSTARKAYQQGHRLLAEGKAEEALPLLAEAVGEEADQALFQWGYGEALLKTGNAEGGLAAQGEAARLDPARYRLDYAKSLGVNEQRAAAVEQFEAILESSPDDPEALRGAGWYIAQGGDFNRGLPLLRRAVEQRDSDPGLLTSLAAMEAAAGRAQEAAGTYWKAVQLAPANAEARRELARLLVQTGKPEVALDVLKRGGAHSPGAGFDKDVGGVLERLGRPAEAAQAYRSYVLQSPGAADAEEIRQKADRLDPAGRTGS